jgi:2-dehydropantoate 2-reductase
LKDTLSQTGLTLTHFKKPSIHIPPTDLEIVITPSALKDCDIIFLCTKSQHTVQAAKQIKEHAPAKSHIVSCQNGISNVPVLKTVLEKHVGDISGAIVPFNVTPTQAGTYHCGTGGTLHIEHNLPSDVTHAFASIGQEIKYGDNFAGDQWAKLLVNLNNALNTLSGGTLREGLEQRAYRQALSEIVGEGLRIAEAHGINVGQFNGRSPKALITTLKLPNWAYLFIMQMIVKIDAKARSSMLDDLESGRLSEIDFLQGEIVRQAQKLGLNAPKNEAILKVVKQAFKEEKSPKLSGKDILELIKD